MFFGAFINPLVAGLFEQAFGLHNAFPAMALVAVLCGLPVVLSRRQPLLGAASSGPR